VGRFSFPQLGVSNHITEFDAWNQQS
jgi:hypothetical protein